MSKAGDKRGREMSDRDRKEIEESQKEHAAKKSRLDEFLKEVSAVEIDDEGFSSEEEAEVLAKIIATTGIAAATTTEGERPRFNDAKMFAPLPAAVAPISTPASVVADVLSKANGAEKDFAK